MKTVGLVVEYNPFHNGHAHHLQCAKQAAAADVVIAVMSGNFLQRGEPALVSKWCRTEMALKNGADLVFELPYAFATQQANTFANGAVSILDAAGCDSLCFGSESGEIDSFLSTIEYLDSHKGPFNESIKESVKAGVSYPKAISLAFQQMEKPENLLDIGKPNNILGLEYIKAIKGQNSTMEPLTVARKNAGYHDEHFASATIASATSIRKALFSSGEDISIDRLVPETTGKLLREYNHDYGGFHQWENYWNYLQFRLLHLTPQELREIYEVEEGLENRLIPAAAAAGSFQEFMTAIKTKRYTWTRLQRVCVHILTNTKKNEMSLHTERASYLRLLGMTQAGRYYLNSMKGSLGLPLISKLSSYKGKEIELDIKASKIYSMALPPHLRREMMEREYKPPIYVP